MDGSARLGSIVRSWPHAFFFGWPFLSGCYLSGWLLAVATVISEKSRPSFLAAATVFTAQYSHLSRNTVPRCCSNATAWIRVPRLDDPVDFAVHVPEI
jgi:hypothetical protein